MVHRYSPALRSLTSSWPMIPTPASAQHLLRTERVSPFATTRSYAAIDDEPTFVVVHDEINEDVSNDDLEVIDIKLNKFDGRRFHTAKAKLSPVQYHDGRETDARGKHIKGKGPKWLARVLRQEKKLRNMKLAA